MHPRSATAPLRRRRLAKGLGLWGLALGLAAWLGLSVGAGCRGEAASAEQCARILDRIVELELREQGYRDPELARRKQAEFRRLFAEDLGECVGRRLPPAAMACIEAAVSAEQVSHLCLR
ncbi:MAG: hypothetical protein R3B09_14220 [Nannocystaceae bacterium]